MKMDQIRIKRRKKNNVKYYRILKGVIEVYVVLGHF